MCDDSMAAGWNPALPRADQYRRESLAVVQKIGERKLDEAEIDEKAVELG